MKKNILGKILPASAALVALSGVNAHATIALSMPADLNFGSITPGATGGSVTIAPGGGRSVTGSVTQVVGNIAEQPAQISISGNTGVMIEVTFPAASYNVDDAGAGSPMSVGSFDFDGNGTATTITLPSSPIIFPIGATLTVGAGQTGGSYSGVYTINVNYQ